MIGLPQTEVRISVFSLTLIKLTDEMP